MNNHCCYVDCDEEATEVLIFGCSSMHVAELGYCSSHGNMISSRWTLHQDEYFWLCRQCPAPLLEMVASPRQW